MGNKGSKASKINQSVPARLRARNIPAILLDQVSDIKEVKQENNEIAEYLFFLGEQIAQLNQQVEDQEAKIILLEDRIEYQKVEIRMLKEPIIHCAGTIRLPRAKSFEPEKLTRSINGF